MLRSYSELLSRYLGVLPDFCRIQDIIRFSVALPVIVVIGRPNVGKSTLANRLCNSREAIVHNRPGITRDRNYQDGFWKDRSFRVVDTGGLVFDDDTEFLPEIRVQANAALAEAAVALVVVDGQQGVTAADEAIANWLRIQTHPADSMGRRPLVKAANARRGARGVHARPESVQGRASRHGARFIFF